MIDLLVAAGPDVMNSDSLASNPVSDFLYDLLPIATAAIGVLALAFRKRVETWASGRREDKFAAVLAPILEQQDERDAAILEVLQDIHSRLPPSVADVEAAFDLLRQAGKLEPGSEPPPG